MPTYTVATACDQAYAEQALNLVGSIQTRSPQVEAIYVYDLGMTLLQRLQFRGIKGVKLTKVTPFAPYWRQCWSWKPWIWLNTPATNLIFLDAGTEVLGDLGEIAAHIEKDDYFLVSQYETLASGHTLVDIIPSSYYKQFDLPTRIKTKPVVAAGIIGFKTDSAFFREVLQPTYDLVLQGYNLGWSEAELGRNRGIHYSPQPIVRDCPYFRHDQTLLNLMLYKQIERPVIQPFAKYGGVTSPAEHPEQLIWNGRAHNPLVLVSQIDYIHLKSVRNQLNRWYLAWYKSGGRRFVGRISTKLRRLMEKS